MKKQGYSTARSLMLTGLLLPALLILTHCKLTNDNTQKAEVYPETGAKDVPANVVIEVKFPGELKIAEKQMQKDLFTIRQCTMNNFSYFKDPTKEVQTPAAPATTTENADGTKKSDGTATSTAPKTENTTPSTPETKYGQAIKLFPPEHFTDSTGAVHNYLVINPENRERTLEPNTTYCLSIGALTNADGVKIGPQETSFTTTDTVDFHFESESASVDFLGNRLTTALKDEDGKSKRDYMVLNFPGQSIRPEQLKQKIKVCLEDTSGTSTSEACRGYGKDTQFDVYLIESLQSDDNTNRMISRYSVYAVSPRITLSAGRKFKLVVDQDFSKNDMTVGTMRDSIYEVDDDGAYNIDDITIDKTSITKSHHINIGSGS